MLIVVLALLVPFAGQAQKTTIYTFPEKDFHKGMELFEKEKYGAARSFFEKTIDGMEGTKSDLRAEAQYYSALCAINLLNIDAEYLVHRFVSENPENPMINDAWFRLGDYLYVKKDYGRTIKYLDKVDRYLLNKDQLSQYYFQKGYCYYMRNDYENARVCLYEVKDVEGKYAAPALYYYSHIAYAQKNYETALQGFLRLVDDENFASIAPYYIAQIYYLQRKFEKVIGVASPLMATVTDKRAAEMSKIIGESYFYLENYKEAIPYLEKYQDEFPKVTIEDKYQLAYAYYMTGAYDNARELFERISLTNTEISQSSLYHLADSYLKLGNKIKARNAFASAARLDFNHEISEDALFNYAKLTYELSYSPFNEAVRAFNNYLSLYPASKRSDEAYNYLVLAYLDTRNYRMALEALEKIREKDRGMEKAYQKVAFFRGLELFNNLRFTDAIAILDKSLKFSTHDRIIYARTLYWLAESYFRLNDQSTALNYYQLFLQIDVAVNTPEFKMVNYSMAYLEYANKNYAAAEKWFNAYIAAEKNKNAVTLADAWNRLADCRYIDADYWKAMEYYDKVIELNKAEVDYAYFQKGFTLGLVDRLQRKIETLQQLIEKFPKSAYVDDALFETGRSYAILNQPAEAAKNYNRILKEYPNSNYIDKTLVQLGLLARNEGRNEEALGYYRKVVVDYPGTMEASNALKSIQDIYVDQNKVDAYLAFLDEIGGGITSGAQDSLVYAAAENAYLAGDCDKSAVSLDSYIKRFPSGTFLLNAHYYLADCLLKLKRPDEAYPSLEYIINQPQSMFTEAALVAASAMAYRKKDYNRAAELYQKTIQLGESKANINEAQINLMRSYALLDEYQNTINTARQVLLQDKVEAQIVREASYLIATSFMKQNDIPSAYEWFAKIAGEVNSEQGAEARYTMAEISFNRGDVEEAEKTVFQMIDMNTPHQFWMGKTFLLLSRIYLAKNDDFQAVQTLESIINYYPVENDGIRDEAVRSKKEITERVNSETLPITPQN
jgi:tetratricopeptide (TPR) repeat protein